MLQRCSHCCPLFVELTIFVYRMRIFVRCLLYCLFSIFLWFRRTRINKQTTAISYLRLKKTTGGLIISFLDYKYNNNYIVMSPWLLNIKEMIYYKLSKSIILLYHDLPMCPNSFLHQSFLLKTDIIEWLRVCLLRVLY